MSFIKKDLEVQYSNVVTFVIIMHLNYKSGYWTPVHEQKQSYMRLPYILFTKTLRDQWKDVVSYLELAQKCISK